MHYLRDRDGHIQDSPTPGSAQFYESLKSRKELRSFLNYCMNHPEERFWQALRNWSEYPAILTGKPSKSVMSGVGYEADKDTFYFKGRRHDEES